MTRSGAPRSRRRRELGLEQPQPVPLHERAEQIDLVAGVDLGAQLGPEIGSPVVLVSSAASDSGVRVEPSGVDLAGRRDDRQELPGWR